LGFAVAGSDGKWGWTSAVLGGDTVFLTSSLAKPSQVEYAWANQPIGNLRGASGLPATPFRMEVSSRAPVDVGAERPADALRLALRLRGDLLEVEAPSEVLSCEVFDLSGRRRLSLHPGSAAFAVDLADFPAGLWILRATWDGGASRALFRR
jgi:hypothetical protein